MSWPFLSLRDRDRLLLHSVTIEEGLFLRVLETDRRRLAPDGLADALLAKGLVKRWRRSAELTLTRKGRRVLEADLRRIRS